MSSVRERCPGQWAGIPAVVRYVTFGVLFGWAVINCAHAEERDPPQSVVRLDETVISGNQELPKVLYILPWQQPRGVPDIQVQAEFEEVELFRRLYPPAYRRELSYFETLHRKGDKEQ